MKAPDKNGIAEVFNKELEPLRKEGWNIDAFHTRKNDFRVVGISPSDKKEWTWDFELEEPDQAKSGAQQVIAMIRQEEG